MLTRPRTGPRWWVRVLCLVAAIVALDLMPPLVLLAGLVALVLVWRNPRRWGDWVRTTAPVLPLPGLRTQDRRRFAGVLAAYTLILPALLSVGWAVDATSGQSGLHGSHRHHAPFFLPGVPFDDPQLALFPGATPRPSLTARPSTDPGALRFSPGPSNRPSGTDEQTPAPAAGPTDAGSGSPQPSPVTTGPTPTPKASRAPSPVASASPTPAALTASGSIQPCVPTGGTETISVQTRAGAAVTILVTFPDGSTDRWGGSVASNADSSGRLVDTWTVNYPQHGQPSVSVSVHSGTQSTSASGTFTVVTPGVESCP
jgi:hypothetical protein